MDLHQGINDFNPLRAKPLTAAMQHEKKHIEGSVYDPSTGKTVVSLSFTCNVFECVYRHSLTRRPGVRHAVTSRN